MADTSVLRAARGLTLTLDPDAPWRVQFPDGDWWGPLGCAVAPAGALRHASLDPFTGTDDIGAYSGCIVEWDGCPVAVRTTVRAYADAPLMVFRLEATDTLTGIGTGTFEQPGVAWPTFAPAERAAGGVPDGTTSYGHAYCEFATPATSDAHCATFQRPGHRPPVVEPLFLIAPDGRTLMLAPLDHFHDQIIAVPDGADRVRDGIRCGWHGDLQDVPAGWGTELALWAGDSPRELLGAWAGLLRRRARTHRRGRYADDGVGKLSYWTDNGAVYYYRTLPDTDYATTLERVLDTLDAQDVPVRSVQLDSWFYPHANLRPVSAEGAPVVPPSGMLTWEPRDDVFPEGLAGLRARLRNLPLTFHSRHFDSGSPYFTHYDCWEDGDYAHPTDPAMLEMLVANAAAWGAITYEQDWLVESFLQVRGLREAPGRAAAWQTALDRAAEAHGLTLQWCMGTPADFMHTVHLRNVTSIRTSGDYRYVFDNGLNWFYFLQTNALARALGLHPFKDVFISHAETEFGEPYAEVEALIAGLSAGPVGIGDALGHTDRDIVMRTCREDGVLVKPDVPLAALDRCFRTNAFFEHAPLIGETYSEHPAGRWIYIASFNASAAKQRLDFRVELADLGRVCPESAVMAYDWRTGDAQRLDPAGGWDLALGFQEWDYRVLCPILPGDVTVFGDVAKYATVGDRRIGGIAPCAGGVQFDVLGAPATWVEVCGWAAKRPAAVAAGFPTAPVALEFAPQPTAAGPWWRWDPPRRQWIVRVHLGAAGRNCVQVRVQ